MASPSRLAYIDWLRGLACVLMFQTHCYDAWLGGEARNSKFAMWSQLGGTFPAPLFLFLAGVSFALIINKLLAKGFSANPVAKTTIRRGAEILGLGLLFRIQEFLVAWRWAPWTDLFRVDILNTIGISIVMMGLVCWVVMRSSRFQDSWKGGRPGPPTHDIARASGLARLVLAALVAAAAISAFTPLLWTSWRPRFLPWELETYINGVHNLGQPQPWLFPIFPWTAFAFAGLTFGLLLLSDRATKLGGRFFALTAATGPGLIYLAKFLDSRKLQIYPVFDFWHSSPEFFMIRVGLLLLIAVFAYGWCRWGAGQWAFSPLIQLGKTSLLVYWVHIELVYGRVSVLPHHSQTVLGASGGLLVIFVGMLSLSLVRTKTRGMFKTPLWSFWNDKRLARPAEQGRPALH